MTGTYTLPNLAEPIRELLLADGPFAALTQSRLGTRAPEDVTTPYAVLRCAASPLSSSSRSVGWRGTVQLHGCATGWVNSKAPETVSWDICAAAARVLDRSGQQIWGDVTYTPRLTDGPLPMDPDRSRGEANVVHWALIRAELIIHLR
ncbi:hypothetical protein [Amycolatopsis sp. NPDC059657]|uniref:hypothetical protein n=1 Tax=Amycolatopsis sp. NPDC059657 TaxID=3346899 RepID=UPI00366B2856